MTSLTDTTDPKANRLTLIYGWAGVGVMAVVFHNTSVFFHDHRLSGLFVSTLLDAGWVGIPLLLLIAGFFSTGVLLDAPASSGFAKGLYGKVFRHTAPLYFLTLLIAFVVLPHALEPGAWTESVTNGQFWYWTLLKNWVPSSGAQISGFEHIWLLSDGWPMLLIWPLLARMGAWRAAILTAVASIVWRDGMLATGASAATVYHSAWNWFDAIGVGSLLAVAVRNDVARNVIVRHRWKAFAAATVGLGAIVVARHGFDAGDAVVVGVGTSIVLVWFGSLMASTMVGTATVDTYLRRLVEARGVQLLGANAFAIYMLHFPLHRALTAVIEVGAAAPMLDLTVRLAYSALVLVASAALAIALSYAVRVVMDRLDEALASEAMGGGTAS